MKHVLTAVEPMPKFATVISIVAVAAAILVVGVVVGWLGSRETVAPPPSSAPEEPGSATPLKFAKSRPQPVETPVMPPTASPPRTPAITVTNNWEDKIDNILAAEGKETDKAKQLLALFPTVPEAGQVEVAEHLSNLVADADYAPLGELLTNPGLPEAVLDVLMADILNRPNSLKLPMILAVARIPQHPKATEAKDLLELFLEGNYDQDWSQWQARMDQWLKDNPD